MEEHARHVYKKVKSGNMININTLKQEIEQDWELSKLDNIGGDINPYRELIINNAEEIDTVLSQIKEWSILSNEVNYIHYDRHPRNFHSLNISTVNKREMQKKFNYKRRQKKCARIRFYGHTRKIKRRIPRCVQRYTIRNIKHYKVWENSDLSTTYLGMVDTSKNSKIKAEESFPI